MAIQIPNPGTGNGATGDNEFVLWSKVKDNFNNTSHAASRLVGTNNGNIAEYSSQGLGDTGLGAALCRAINPDDFTEVACAFRFNNVADTPVSNRPYTGIRTRYDSNTVSDLIFGTGGDSEIYHRLTITASTTPSSTVWRKLYHTGNTTKEAETGYLVASSPILKVQHDNFEKVHEAVQLDIDVQHLETGIYAITGTTGLRENDGWNLKPPKDVNGNVLCICEATQEGDVITLKTYKKKFDFETVSIVADYEQPTDIPDGAEVMLRFNDLPIEDDTQTEV